MQTHLTTPQLKQTITRFVKQRCKIEKLRPCSINTTTKHSLDKVKRHVDFLSNNNNLESWVGMVSHLYVDFHQILPSALSKYKKQRKAILAIVEECGRLKPNA
jgi:hypothetical protein